MRKANPVTHRYQARDVVNAPALKVAIKQRSALRNDHPDVTAWLCNHFFRWLIGCFEQVIPIASVNEYQQLSGEPAPTWLIQRFQTGNTNCFYIQVEQRFLLERELRLVEFLNARQGTSLAGKLQRINCHQALARWEKEHAKIQDRQRRGWIPNSGLALKRILTTSNGTWFSFDSSNPHLREEMAYESYHMQHCLGQFGDRKRLTGGYGEFYAEKIQSGELRLFTFRSSGNSPHITLSLQVRDHTLSVDQVKGKQNRPPITRYLPDILVLFTHLNLAAESHPDCEAMGLVMTPDKPQWQLITELQNTQQQNNLLVRQPQLFALFPQLSTQQQWLALASPHLRSNTDLLMAPTLRLASAQGRPHTDDPAWLIDLLNGTGEQWQIEGITLTSIHEMGGTAC